MRRLWVCVILVSASALGCAGPNRTAAQATRIPYAELWQGNVEKHAAGLSRLPLVLEFKAGDEVPVNLVIESRLIDLKAPPLVIRAKRNFFVLLRQSGPPLFSEDGKDFTQRAKNGFLFGFGVQKGELPKVTAKIRFRAEP